MKFKVTYVHEVEITYEAIIEADSEAEAREKMDNFDIESEEQIDYQGVSIEIQDVEELEED